MPETELEVARRHVAEGERHVAIQQDILRRMQAGTRDLDMAEATLVQFEHTLTAYRIQLARLEAGIKPARPPLGA
jgi:hypothetical protein